MGNQPSSSIRKANYEDIQSIASAMTPPMHTYLINVLPANMQDCLIKNTVDAKNEEALVNRLLGEASSACIIVYGKNSSDVLAYHKYEQLLKLGFGNVAIYTGGLFEWLMLQDIYGDEFFKTTKRELDILKFKADRLLGCAAGPQHECGVENNNDNGFRGLLRLLGPM